MGKICAVKSCPSGRKLKNRNKDEKYDSPQSLSYFQPTTPARLKNWRKSLGIKLKASDYICHLHFKEEHMKMYDKFYVNGELKIFPTGKNIVKDEASPTIEHQFVPIPAELITSFKLKSKKPNLHSDHSDHENQIRENDIEQQEFPEEDNLKNQEETDDTIQLENFKDNIHKLPMLPPFWLHVDKPNGIEFIQMDPSTGRTMRHIRLNEDTSVTVILRNNEELPLNEKIKSYSKIFDYLKFVERWPLCVGTQLDNNRFSKMCKGVIIGEDTYKRNQHNPRCKSCRILRIRLKNRKPTSVYSERVTRKSRSLEEQCNSLKLMFCRMCLTMEDKMHDMKDLDLIEMYQNITGIPVQLDAACDNIHQCVCRKCAARLTAAAELREKAVLSDGLLHNLLKEKHSVITRKDIQSIKTIVTKYEYPESVPTKDVEIDIVCNNNYKENEINSSNEDNDDESDTLADDIEDKEIITNQYLEIDDSEDELVNEVEIENTGDVNYEKTLIKSNADIILVNKKGRKLFLDENDGLFKVNSLGVANEDMIKTAVDTKDRKNRPEGSTNKLRSTIVEEDKSVENRDDEEQEVRTNSKAKVKIVKKKLKASQLKTGTVKSTKEVLLKRRLRYNNTDAILKGTRSETFRSLFTITPLTHEQQIEEISKRQESEKYINAPYKCTVCYRGYRDKERCATHMEKHDSQNGAYECLICKTRMKTSRALQNHLYSQHTEEYSCTKCQFVTRSKRAAYVHQKFHAGTKYQCPHCDLLFDQYTTYMGHLRIKHVSDFVCELCGYTFVSKKGIDVHKNRRHIFVDEMVTLEGPYCEVCDVKFASEEAHDRHLRLSSKHISEKDPSRLRNDSFFKFTDGKPRHVGVLEAAINSFVPSDHKSLEPVTCEQCGKQLRNLRVYAHHFRRAHPEKMRTKYAIKPLCMCELCGSIFHNMTLLKSHMWVHTGEKQFKCDQCTKSYSQKSRLDFHMKVHSATRPSYECPLCGKHFSLYGNRQRHMITHTDLKPFKCDRCGKCFNSYSAHQTHVKHIHLKEPWPKRSR